ncbi:MAG: glycosyltransferase family 9 protein [Spirochaetota bacterium]
MKYRRIVAPGKTLVVAGIDRRFMVFTAWFLHLWKQRFAARPFVASAAEPGDLAAPLVSSLAEPVHLPEKFLPLLWFLLKGRFGTLIILNPDLRSTQKLRLAARLAGIRQRAGFAPLRRITGLNLSLPFNNENHHYVHQLRTFFEYITGEKTTGWTTPEFPATAMGTLPGLPAEPFGIIAYNPDETESQHMETQLKKLTNLMARSSHCVLVLRSRKLGRQALTRYARSFSEVMTEQALANTTLLVLPEETALLGLLREAAWIAAADSELLNLAALFAVPSVAVFGPLNERVWQPFSVRTRALTGEFACRPCTAYPGQVECSNSIPWACLAGASAELMAATLTAVLRRKRHVT